MNDEGRKDDCGDRGPERGGVIHLSVVTGPPPMNDAADASFQLGETRS